MQTKRRGRILVFSSPSGAGKTSILAELRKRLPDLAYSVSATTRPPRRGETQGVDFHYLNEDEFRRRIASAEFAEWAEVHGNLYGTPKALLKEAVDAGRDVILDIDVQGGRRLKAIYPDAVMIYIAAPSFDVLEARLRRRGTESEASIRHRVRNAREEIRLLERYDYKVVNEDLGKAVDAIIGILRNHCAGEGCHAGDHRR